MIVQARAPFRQQSKYPQFYISLALLTDLTCFSSLFDEGKKRSMMTTITTSTMIFVGNLATIDNDESDWDTDAASAIAGVYDSFDDLEVVDVVNHDTDDDGAIFDDEAGGSDYVSYSLGGTNYTDVPDASILYNATVTELDGTVHNVEVLIVQMTNGDTFVGDIGNLDNLTIRSIELLNPTTTNAAGYYTHHTISNTAVCFAQGTCLDTTNGPCPIEKLRVGDMVGTLDHGPKPIRWIGSVRLPTPKHLAPITFAKGALGKNVPNRALTVSPQHRVLVKSKIAKRMFGRSEVLVAAKTLLGLPKVTQALPMLPVRYWHVLFDRHELVVAHDVVTETLLPARQTMRALPSASVEEILTLFPELSDDPEPVRLVPSPKQQTKIVARHFQNSKPIQEAYPSTLV